ncbi:HGxxPAAW family protein [Kitasatospora sp. NPDC036755]|uniref:HGxxPAAW family protein n=1 Tax=Kitasatospora sp. NPDC036755 TaxID=3154600 RepID=UPI0033C069B8
MAAAAHGHTPAAWTGVIISFVGFGVAGVAMILPSVLLTIVGAAIIVAGGVVGMIMSAAGMGKQASTNVYKTREEQIAAREARAAVTA